jgi:hypothetical protein
MRKERAWRWRADKLGFKTSENEWKVRFLTLMPYDTYMGNDYL